MVLYVPTSFRKSFIKLLFEWKLAFDFLTFFSSNFFRPQAIRSKEARLASIAKSTKRKRRGAHHGAASAEKQIRSQWPSQQSAQGARLRRVHVHPCCRLRPVGLNPGTQSLDAARAQVFSRRTSASRTVAELTGLVCWHRSSRPAGSRSESTQSPH